MFTSVAFSLTSCSLVELRKVEVKGMVYSSERETPIKDAKVKVTLHDPVEILEVETNEKGEFLVSSDGSMVLSERFIEEDDFKKNIRKIVVSLSHPDFVEDTYEEEFEVAPVEMKLVDVGAFYLAEKEDEDFLKHLSSQNEDSSQLSPSRINSEASLGEKDNPMTSANNE